MDYKFYFNEVEDAKYFCDRVSEIAEEYDTVRLADLYDLIGESGNYLANEVIWTRDTIFYDVYYSRDVDGRYYVRFPEPDQYPASASKLYKDYDRAATHRSAVFPKKTPTPEPLNITINNTSITYTTIREVIQQANKIEDRPVFITIN